MKKVSAALGRAASVLVALVVTVLLASSPTLARADESVLVTGGITLTEVNGEKFYDTGSGPVSYDGSLSVTTEGVEVSGTLSVQSGSHVITLDDAKFKGGAGIDLAVGTKLDVMLVGENSAHGTYMSPGVNLPQDATLIINAASTGSIDCAGEDRRDQRNRGYPGIGNAQAMGTLVVNGGHVIAHAAEGNSRYGDGGNKANAIGTASRGSVGSGGTIIINGGTVEAIGKDSIPAIGGFDGSPQKGSLKMTGGELVIGTGGSKLDSMNLDNALVSGQLSGTQTISDSLVNGTVFGSYTLSKDATLDSVTVPAGAELTVAEGATLSCSGTVDVQGSLAIDGTIEAGVQVGSGSSVSGSGTVSGTIRKGDQAAPADVAASGVTASSLTVVATTTGAKGAVSYALVEGASAAPDASTAWQPTAEFSGLKAGAAYTAYVRFGGNDFYNEATSAGATVWTAKAAPASGEGYAIDYVAETAASTQGFELSLDGVDWGAGPVALTPGGSVFVRAAADAGGAPASRAVSVALAPRPAAPQLSATGETLDGENDGALAIGNYAPGTAYEISSETGAAWADATVGADGRIVGLADGTYQVRVKAVAGSSFAGEAASATIEAGTPRTYVLSVSVGGFADTVYGYPSAAPQQVAITSSGNSAATVSAVTLEGSAAAAFVVSGAPGATIEPGVTDAASYAVAPAVGLNAGTYQATLVVAYDGGATARATVSFVVAPAEQTAPAGVGVSDEMTAGGNDGALSGLPANAEWRAAGGTWSAASDSSVAGLAPGTYEVRLAADRNHRASPAVTLTVRSFGEAHGGIGVPDGSTDDGTGKVVLPNSAGMVTLPGGGRVTLPAASTVDPQTGVATAPDGTTVTAAADGALLVTFPDGTEVTVPSDATVTAGTVEMPSGATVAPAGGGMVKVTLPDATVLLAPSGSRVRGNAVTDPQGNAMRPAASQQTGTQTGQGAEQNDGLAATGEPAAAAGALPVLAGLMALAGALACRRRTDG